MSIQQYLVRFQPTEEDVTACLCFTWAFTEAEAIERAKNVNPGLEIISVQQTDFDGMVKELIHGE